MNKIQTYVNTSKVLLTTFTNENQTPYPYIILKTKAFNECKSPKIELFDLNEYLFGKLYLYSLKQQFKFSLFFTHYRIIVIGHKMNFIEIRFISISLAHNIFFVHV